MKEDIELDIEVLNEIQLYNLLMLGEIDSITYYECIEELKSKKKSIFISLFNKIKNFILKKEQ